MRRVLIKLNEKGLQKALPSRVHCLRILEAEVRRGLLHILAEAPDKEKEEENGDKPTKRN